MFVLEISFSLLLLLIFAIAIAIEIDTLLLITYLLKSIFQPLNPMRFLIFACYTKNTFLD
jgi:hypothetical protein